MFTAFLARVNPVSTSAKPACMKNTRNAARHVHTIFRFVWSSSFTAAASVPPSAAAAAAANTVTHPATLRQPRTFPAVFIVFTTPFPFPVST